MSTWGDISRNISALLVARGEEWAGLPIPLPHLRLTLEPRNPWRDRLATLEQAIHKDDDDDDDDDDRHGAVIMGGAGGLASGVDDTAITVRNAWFSSRLGRTVYIFQDANGQVSWGLSKFDYVRRFQMLFNTMRATTAWTTDAEFTAVEKLATMIPEHLWQAYMLTGAFLETSRRSRVTYFFRRCRPTIAIRDERMLCTLCLHPTGYYEGTFAGSLCPTDDVIAHLLLMRGDEPLFWRRANQHAPDQPESGL